MGTQWEEAFGELREYIADTPSVEIGDVISIPSTVRAEFYGKFDKVRHALLEDVLTTALFDKALILSQKYTELEREIIHKFNLKKITLEPTLNSFLQDPRDVFMRELYFPLFDLLKGKIDQATFQKNCSVLPSKFHELYRLGYSKWISLALLKLFKAKKIGAFNLAFNAKSQKNGVLIKDLPRYFAADFIEFKSNTPFVVPDFAAYSPKLKCYLAIKTEMQRSIAKFAYSPHSSETRKWVPLDPSLDIFTPDNIFVYISSNAEDISLLVNKAVCCPEIIIRCFPQDCCNIPERTQETISLQKALSPRSTYVIRHATMSEQNQTDDSIKSIKTISVGFDQSKLTDVVNELVGPFKTSGPVGGIRDAKSKVCNWLKWIASPFTPASSGRRLL